MFDKQAFYRFAGRELGLRTIVRSAADQIDKTAAAGQAVDADHERQVAEYAGSLGYTNELQKIARKAGQLEAYQQVSNLIATGAGLNKIAENLAGVLDKAAQFGAPLPANEGEMAEFQNQMVAGVAETLGTTSGLDPNSPAVLDRAIGIVSSYLGA